MYFQPEDENKGYNGNLSAGSGPFLFHGKTAGGISRLFGILTSLSFFSFVRVDNTPHDSILNLRRCFIHAQRRKTVQHFRIYASDYPRKRKTDPV
jgi:hypothetical protein